MQANIRNIIILVIFTRILDGVSTYISSPDLSDEKNILVTIGNFGWAELIFAGVILVILTVIGLLLSYKKNDYFNIQTETLNQYIKLYFLVLLPF